MQNCYHSYQSHLKSLLTVLSERLFPCAEAWTCLSEGFVYQVQRALKRICCMYLHSGFWNARPELGYKASGLLPCVCVCCCWAPVLSADQWRLAAGRKAAFHLSSIQLCNLGRKKNNKRARQKRGERTGAHVSRQILQVLFFIFLFNILQRKVPPLSLFLPVCTSPVRLLICCVLFFHQAQTRPEKSWRLRSNNTFNHKINCTTAHWLSAH